MMEKLKPCPFCGGEANRGVRIRRRRIIGFDVMCNVCKASISWQNTEDDATEAWNRRVERGEE